jgi:hypothetical protein
MAGSTTSWPFDRWGRSSRVAFCGGVAASSLPPIRSVSTFESWTRVYSVSSGPAGHASKRRPPAVRKSVPGLPITDPRSSWVAKKRRAWAASARATAATSPHTCTFGKIAWVIRESSHAPLPSPFSAASSVSIVHGALSGPAPSVVACMSPKNAPSPTLPLRIGRNHQWSGMWAYAEWIEAARSGVRLLHDASSAQRAA